MIKIPFASKDLVDKLGSVAAGHLDLEYLIEGPNDVAEWPFDRGRLRAAAGA